MKKLLLLLLLVSLAVSCRQKEEAVSEHQHPSVPLMQMEEEIRMVQEAVKTAPDNANAWIKLGNLLMDSQRFSEAAEAYQKALNLDPKNVDVRVDMGTCYRNSGRSDIAAKEFRKALEMDPAHLTGRKNLAVVLAYDLRDTAQAIKEFEKYLKLAPGAPDVEQVKQEIERLKTAK